MVGDEEASLKYAYQALNQAMGYLDRSPDSGWVMRKLARIEFRIWEATGQAPSVSYEHNFSTFNGRESPRSCDDAMTGLRLALMNDRKEDAAGYARYLVASGFDDLEFQRLCRVYSVCG